MQAYSPDLRERVVRAVDQGYKRTDIIKLFGVSRATIKPYLKQRRETGHVNRKPIPGRPPKKGAHLQAGLVAQLEAYPDATLEMHCQFWEQTQGVRVSMSTMSRVIQRIGWTRKKKTLTPVEKVQIVSSFSLFSAKFERNRQENCPICSSINDFFNKLLRLLRAAPKDKRASHAKTGE